MDSSAPPVPYRQTMAAQDTPLPSITCTPHNPPLPIVHPCPPEEAARLKAFVADVSARGHVDLAGFSRSPIPYLVSPSPTTPPVAMPASASFVPMQRAKTEP